MTAALLLAVLATAQDRPVGAVPEGVRLAHDPSFDAEGRTVAWSGVIGDRMWLYVGGERRRGPYD